MIYSYIFFHSHKNLQYNGERTAKPNSLVRVTHFFFVNLLLATSLHACNSWSTGTVLFLVDFSTLLNTHIPSAV